MKYRLGHRAKFYAIRRLGRKWHIACGALGVLAVIAVGVNFGDAPQALGLAKKHAANTTHTSPSGTPSNKQVSNTGSSKQPPSTVKGGVVAASSASGNPTGLRVASCVGFAPQTPGLASATNTELRKLAQYQQACNGQIAGRSSFFVPTPSTTAEAQSYASDIVATLKQYAQYGITPLVFMEPDTATGTDLDLVQYQNGAYDTALDTYFASIKSAGVSDAMMGMWVMLPEGNLPEWTSTDPTVFAADVTKVAGFQKKYFPASQTSVMLDSESYPAANSWSGGAYTSLVPYVQSIPKGLIDSFGLQGFPWAPPANESSPGLYDPTVYLRTDLAAAAARSLGVSNIWLNTGTFSTQYANNAAETVTVSPISRQAMLNGVLTQAKGLQSQGFGVSVHLFAQDKAATSEAINWSYWQTPGDSPNTTVFTTFAHDLSAANIPLWIFDTY